MKIINEDSVMLFIQNIVCYIHIHCMIADFMPLSGKEYMQHTVTSAS